VKLLDDGAFKIIEPTVGRVDLQSHVATLNGLNIPLVAYLCALDRPREAAALSRPARHDVAWIDENSLYCLLRAGAVGASFLCDLARRPKGFALAHWSDPRVIGAFAKEILERLARRAWERCAPSPEGGQSEKDRPGRAGLPWTPSGPWHAHRRGPGPAFSGDEPSIQAGACDERPRRRRLHGRGSGNEW
jgi:hypothetical protein